MDSDRGSNQKEEQGGGVHQQQEYSTSELMASAKVVAEAAQSGFGSADKAKLADAAGDLVGGARQYGKLDDKGMGQYAEKAENYLHNYSGGGGGGAGGGQPEKPSESKPEEHSEGGGGGGFGGVMKMAQGFMK